MAQRPINNQMPKLEVRTNINSNFEDLFNRPTPPSIVATDGLFSSNENNEVFIGVADAGITHSHYQNINYKY